MSTPYPKIHRIKNVVGAPANDEKSFVTPPDFLSQIKSLYGSSEKFIKSGAQIASEELIKKRLDICSSCEFWNASGFNKTGRCMKCGCSTWVKLRMGTESCPIGKWGPANHENDVPEAQIEQTTEVDK